MWSANASGSFYCGKKKMWCDQRIRRDYFLKRHGLHLMWDRACPAFLSLVRVLAVDLFNLSAYSLGHLQQSFKFISIFISILHYSTTFYLFFQINNPAVLFILLSILLKYTFLLLFSIQNNQLPPNQFLTTKQTN